MTALCSEGPLRGRKGSSRQAHPWVPSWVWVSAPALPGRSLGGGIVPGRPNCQPRLHPCRCGSPGGCSEGLSPCAWAWNVHLQPAPGSSVPGPSSGDPRPAASLLVRQTRCVCRTFPRLTGAMSPVRPPRPQADGESTSPPEPAAPPAPLNAPSPRITERSSRVSSSDGRRLCGPLGGSAHVVSSCWPSRRLLPRPRMQTPGGRGAAGEPCPGPLHPALFLLFIHTCFLNNRVI